jgi:hypothetical protein
MASIKALLKQRDELSSQLKEVRKQIQEAVEGTDVYKAIFESTVSTVDENGYEVTEKDAAKHAFKITLKNLETH